MSDLSEIIRKTIDEAKAPVTLSTLQKRTKAGSEELQRTLSAEVARQAIYRWPDFRKNQRFWRRPAEEAVREAALAAASERAMPSVLLAKVVKKRVPGYPEKLISAAIQELLRDKRLRKYSSFGRERFLLGNDGNPRAYALAAREAVQAILEKLKAAGAGPEDLQVALGLGPEAPAVAPTPQNDQGLDEKLLRAMEQIEPAHSAPVSVRELRAALPQADKQAIDEAALRLRASGKVYLSRHDFPQSLAPKDRDSLIDGQDGHYYVAITARTE